MLSLRKTLLLLVLCWGLQACEQKSEPIKPQTTLTVEQPVQVQQALLQQALRLQQLQLQQQVYLQTFKTVQTHEQQLDQQLKVFSATQACALAGNCRVETQIVPAR